MHAPTSLPNLLILFILLLLQSDSIFGDILKYQQIEPFLSADKVDKYSNSWNTNQIKITTAAGEFEPARVLIESSTQRGETTAVISNLIDLQGNVILAKNIDLYNILRWTQIIPHAYRNTESPREQIVDELLIKDDTMSMIGNWRSNRYEPPAGKKIFRTALKARKLKQLWLTIYTPADTEPGIYRGQITLESKTNNTTLPIQLEVLPFNLPVADKIFGISFRGSLAENKRKLTHKSLSAQLIDIKEHGFNSLVVNEHDLETMPAFYSAIKDSGLDGPVVLNFPKSVYMDKDHMTTVLSVINNQKIDFYIHGLAEPNSPEKIKQQLVQNKTIPNWGKSFNALRTETDDTFIENDLIFDWANYNIRSGLKDLTSKGSDGSSRLQTYYWQSYLEDPPRNRYYLGAHLLKTNLDGAMPYVYQAFHSVDPYVEDIRTLAGNKFRDTRLYKVFNTTYPVSDSVISTIQWEAAREGIDDYRYVQFLRSLLELESSDIADDTIKQIKRYLQGIEYKETNPYSPDRKFDAESLAGFRSYAISKILALLESGQK